MAETTPANRLPHVAARRRLTLAIAIAIVLPLVSALYIVLPYLAPVGIGGVVHQVGLPVLVAIILLLGVVQLSALYRLLDLVARAEPPRVPVPSSAATAPTEVGQELQALLASGRTDEVGTLMRELTRILGILQQQASEVQGYAGRFETINEELRNANLRLRELSLTDELTEVGNRRNFEVRIREEINRSTRFGHAFSLLLLDIDGFKKFNDEFGHPQGDAVLRSLGSLMRSMSREGDVPCRIGGEEFAFILPETGKSDAVAFAERMRRGVEGTIKAPDGSRPLTVSVGLAAFPEDGKSPEDLARASDEALYQSKHAGRNRVTAYVRK
ncbi:MAG: GGDEF domain-containing protein [Candidatus Rokuibacteriota bacterium]